MYKICLTCKYEPDWTPFSIGEHSRCNGECKFPLPKLISLPACVTDYIIIKKRKIIRYSDNSGIYRNCKVWEKKEEKIKFFNTNKKK